jgi:hypothetical protein
MFDLVDDVRSRLYRKGLLFFVLYLGYKVKRASDTDKFAKTLKHYQKANGLPITRHLDLATYNLVMESDERTHIGATVHAIKSTFVDIAGTYFRFIS